MTTKPQRELRGWHVLMIALLAFGTIIGVNMTMLAAATGSFPGLVVESAYREGRGWNARETAQAELGWRIAPQYRDGEIALTIEAPDGPVQAADLVLTIGRPATDRVDRRLIPVYAVGAYRSAVDLAPGRWRLEIETRDGPAYRARVGLTVPEPARTARQGETG
ncbi:MAG: FixH family protein [Pseudomonadota bacterium]